MKLYVAGLMTLLIVAPCAAAQQCPKGADHCRTVTRSANATGSGTVSSTTYDNNTSADAIGDAASSATSAALQYFFIIRPAIETLRNMRINRAEGQFAETLDLLNLITVQRVPEVSRAASTMPSIKGHRLGETWEQFVDESPYLETQVKKCENEKRPIAKAHVKRYEFNPCSNVWMMADSPDATLTLDCVAFGLGAGKDMICQDFSGEISFEKGKLASLKLVVSDDWSNVYPDMVEKFGQPTGGDKDKTIAVWSTTKYHVTAAQTEEGTAIAWMTPDNYEQTVKTEREILAAEKQQRGNSLD